LIAAKNTPSKKTSTNKPMINGTFQRISLLNAEPQFQHFESVLGDILPHLGHGRRGIVVSRPQLVQIWSGADAPQNGHRRAVD
jgi:hypothetical protein